MSRYDGLIIPRSYSEYLNKTDSATLSQMLQQLTGLWSHAVSSGDQKPVTSDAVNNALAEYINKTDAATLQQALQLPGVLSEAVAAGDNKAVKSDAVATALANYHRYNSVSSNGENLLIFIGKTTKANNSQAFIQMKVKGGRADGWYGEGTIYLGQNGNLFSARSDTQMSNLTFYINKFENEYYFYCQMTTYCLLTVEVMPGSKFDFVFESVNSPVGIEFWNNTWQEPVLKSVQLQNG